MKGKKNSNRIFLDTTDKSKLTIEKLREYNGFEDVSGDEAKEHIKLIETMARVLFDIYKNEQKSESIKS